MVGVRSWRGSGAGCVEVFCRSTPRWTSTAQGISMFFSLPKSRAAYYAVSFRAVDTSNSPFRTFIATVTKPITFLLTRINSL
jgi:hypothetical protein